MRENIPGGSAVRKLGDKRFLQPFAFQYAKFPVVFVLKIGERVRERERETGYRDRENKSYTVYMKLGTSDMD